MLVLHAAFVERRLHIWAETKPEPNGSPKGRRGRRPVLPSLADHPTAASVDRLRGAMDEAGLPLMAAPENPTMAVAWLPTVAGTPVPSSRLLGESPNDTSSATLAPWQVPTLLLNQDETAEMLCAAVQRRVLCPGVLVGDDLAWWATAWRLAGSLVAAGRFLPGLTKNGSNRWRALWEPVFLADDAERFARLAAAMPAAARALSSQADAAPRRPAADLLRAFVEEAIDYLVRAGLDRLPGVRGGQHAAVTLDSVHDQWLAALRTPGGALEVEPNAAAQLAEQVRQWRQPLSFITTAPFRLCFRLEEPPAETGAGANGSPAPLPAAHGWYVRYLLQAADDPSLLVGVDEVTRVKGRKAALLRNEGLEPRAYLLSALGQAAGICPRIEASLKTSQPLGYELDGTGAFEFLATRALALRQAGFGVLLPGWWTGHGTKLRLSAGAKVTSGKMQAGSGLSLDTLVKFQWQVALGDELLSAAELHELARLKSPLVRVRGQWVQVGADDIEAALKLLKNQTAETLTAREVLRMTLAGEVPDSPLPLGTVAASGWIGDWLGRLERPATMDELPVPSSFTGTLRPYQARGYYWLAFLKQWGLGACLADDMGLGKTIQTLALLARQWPLDRRPTLLICPTSVVGNWVKEAQRFTPELPVLVHHGAGRRKGPAFARAVADQALVVSSYSLAHRDGELLRQVEWANVILDEAQNIKNAEAKQTKAVRGLRAGFRVALTGTPVENNVGDLWSILEFLNPGWLGNQADFKRRFFLPIQARRDPDAAERLKRLTGPFILRRLKTDRSIIADLPDKLEMKVFCTLTKEQATLYQAVVEETTAALDGGAEGIERKGLVLATLSKLKQVCNHPAHFLGDKSPLGRRSGKLARLVEMLDETLQIDERSLVFTQFAEMGTLLQQHLQEAFGREVLFLHGGTPIKQRQQMVERFQNEADGPAVFLLSLKAGGTGLNLTRANHVFHFDRWWNPAVENQATDRAFRIGQTKNVQVHKFLCVGTLEEKIDEMIERKREIAEQVVGAGEAWLTELSNSQLKELFALRAGAVEE